MATNGNDTLQSSGNLDVLEGLGGDDLYIVNHQDVTVIEQPGAGHDEVQTRYSMVLASNVEDLTLIEDAGDINGTGNDLPNTIVGSLGNNVIHGGGANDTISGGLGGVDTLYGDAGDDTLVSAIASGAGTKIDTMYGGVGNDYYIVDNAADVVIELANQGIDTIESPISAALTGHVERLILQEGAGAIDGVGNVLQNEIIGNSSNNRLAGGRGADTLEGGGGDDTLAGGADNDTLIGGEGNDVLNGGAGADGMSGGNGNDTYYVDDSSDSVFEASAAGGLDQVFTTASYILPDYVEKLVMRGNGAIDAVGSNQNNTIVGNGSANQIAGAGGDDVINGGGGDDQLAGDGASPTVGGNDRVNGGDGNDQIAGGGGDDVLNGGVGNDLLYGGSGRDVLIGGTGQDVFNFASIDDSVATAARDRISDFIQGEDVISLSAIDADTSSEADDAFLFIGSAAFSNTAGELRQFAAGTNTIIAGDVDGDGTADFSILLIGTHTLQNTDFVL